MAAPVRILVFRFFLLFGVLSASCQEDEFHEEMLIKPLESGHLYTHFQFTTTWDIGLGDPDAFLHYRLFPKSLGEVLTKYSVQELHLSLTQGLWRHSKWGYPVVDAPPGAELWVWFDKNTEDVTQTWADLTDAFSGLFCASLNFMDKTATVQPKVSFRPEGATDQWHAANNTFLRYSALPREIVCTENLTPWKKLLPCDSRAGLSTFFRAGKLYDTSYHSLGIHFRPVCKDLHCTKTSVELSQTVSVVFEPTVQNGGKQDWTFKKLFGRALSNSCPLATTSMVYVDVTSNKSQSFVLNPAPDRIDTITRKGDKRRIAVYDVKDNRRNNNILNLEAKYTNSIKYKQLPLPLVVAHRFITGYGQERGGIVSHLQNSHMTQNLTVVYMETLPWFIKLYLHSLRIEADEVQIKPLHTHYIPGKDRQSPYQLELILNLPANSTTKISFQFERTFLKWTEYPPDANHGYYINSAVISTVLPEAKHYTAPPQNTARLAESLKNSDAEQFFLRLHTEALLVTLPTPDFSMPYNVICLACTVVAIAFGSLHNLTTRRFTEIDPSKKNNIFTKIKNKIFKRKEKSEEKDSKDDKTEQNETKGKKTKES